MRGQEQVEVEALDQDVAGTGDHAHSLEKLQAVLQPDVGEERDTSGRLPAEQEIDVVELERRRAGFGHGAGDGDVASEPEARVRHDEPLAARVAHHREPRPLLVRPVRASDADRHGGQRDQ